MREERDKQAQEQQESERAALAPSRRGKAPITRSSCPSGDTARNRGIGEGTTVEEQAGSNRFWLSPTQIEPIRSLGPALIGRGAAWALFVELPNGHPSSNFRPSDVSQMVRARPARHPEAFAKHRTPVVTTTTPPPPQLPQQPQPQPQQPTAAVERILPCLTAFQGKHTPLSIPELAT
uniref:Uncharacterized protein n=1 Tax=Coccidioides posadasii RMSCC 3488 TaxID=454284 RepID=A0A0J6FCR8_COCPO|nr:hypothetical protein CPAG_04415 [Coccidioides posadasii RMSCC 3488]